MSSYGYGGWGITADNSDPRGMSEKAYLRKPLPAWDDRWHTLSPAARLAFLEHVKGPVKPQRPGYETKQPSVAADLFAPEALEELTRAGFVTTEPAENGRSTAKSKPKSKSKAKSQSDSPRVFAHKDTYDFVARLRSLRRYHLLAANADASAFLKYISAVFYGGSLLQITGTVLSKVGIQDHSGAETHLDHYVLRHYWPGWVARALNDPLASMVLDAVRQADKPVSLYEITHQFKDDPPELIRAAVDKLLIYLALVEDLQPETHAIMVGLPCAVREALRLADQPRVRPPLTIVENPSATTHETNLIADDLRALLIEVAGNPPLVRQDHDLFQKEVERFIVTLPPLPPWLRDFLGWSSGSRLAQALSWARALQLVTEKREANQSRLDLTTEGREWMADSLDTQEMSILDIFTKSVKDDRHSMRIDPFLLNEVVRTSGSTYGSFSIEACFTGMNIAVMKTTKGNPAPPYWKDEPKDHDALRRALDQTLSTLEPETFYLYDGLAEHLAFAEHNPLNRGLPLEQTVVYRGSQSIPPLEERREEVGRELIRAFIQRRLVPCGALRVATDAQGRIAVARAPRFDAYFGRKVAATASRAPSQTSQVVVQPDFSVIVIGLNTAPLVELAPFCDRGNQRGHQGATVFKITRESVIRAIGQGLKPADIVNRLKRHATHDIPANVLREIQEWSQWTRLITASTHTLLRCPDREAADRVMGALKQQAERISETTVAIAPDSLNTAERNRLRAQGLLIDTASPMLEATPKRRWKSWRG